MKSFWNPRSHHLVLTTTILALGACSSGSGQRTLRFQSDVNVTDAAGKTNAVKKCDPIVVENSPLHAESAGHVGVLVVPIPSEPGVTEITLKPIDEFGGPRFDALLNKGLNEVVSKVIEAQKLLASGKARDALKVIENVQQKNPELTYLNFLKASCLVILGEKDRARTSLERALADFPENEAGRALAASIGMDAGKKK